MGIAIYPSVSGDSGSPIIHHNTIDANLVGIHRGGTCIFDAASEGQPLINVTDTSLCVVDNYYYKVFSAWENVKEALSLQ